MMMLLQLQRVPLLFHAVMYDIMSRRPHRRRTPLTPERAALASERRCPTAQDQAANPTPNLCCCVSTFQWEHPNMGVALTRVLWIASNRSHTMAASSNCRSESVTDSASCLKNTCYINTFSYNIDQCIQIAGDCYFRSLNVTSLNSTTVELKIHELIKYGTAGAICSIVGSCLFLLFSAYLRKYRRWIEQIILSKVVCDLVYAAVLLHQFYLPLLTFGTPDSQSAVDSTKQRISLGVEAVPSNDRTKLQISFGVEVVSLMGLIWIPVLFLEVRNVITFPFSAWGVPKLVTRWCIALVVSFGWACLMYNPDFIEQANYFQYVPIIFIGQSLSPIGKSTTNMCASNNHFVKFVPTD
jgi:hypothetical protein